MPETPASDIDGEPADHSEVLRAALLWLADSDPDPEYPIACFSVSSSEGDLKISCILITEVQNRLLVAVPLAAWNRTLSSRILPARSLSKAVSVSLSACEPFYRTEPLLGIHTKAWVGLLNPEFESAVELESDPTEDFHFLGEDGQILLPFAQALVEVADEKFCFATATSAAEPAAPLQKDASKGTAARLGHLEKAVEGIQTGLSNLLTQMQNMQASSAPSAVGQAPVPPATLAATPKARASGDVGSLPGLDPGVVQSALRAGVHPDHLKEFSRLIARKSGKISNLPKQTDKKKVDVLGESEDELLADGGGAASPTALAEPGDPFAAAWVKLTTIVESLSDNRRRTKDLDDILDDPSGLDGGAHNLVSSGNQRRQAAVLKALQKSLLENPEQIYRKIETLMLEDFGSREAIPGEPTRHGSFRGWLEHRSRIPNLNAAVRTSWGIAGALDALRSGKTMEAQARLGLLLASLDQVACDRGQWILGAEVSLEMSPPFSSFSRHVPPEFGENPHSRLLDSRWVDAMMYRVKELDDYSERRAKLGKRGKKEDETGKDKDSKDGKDKKKGNGKGKKTGAGAEEASPQK